MQTGKNLIQCICGIGNDCDLGFGGESHAGRQRAIERLPPRAKIILSNPSRKAKESLIKLQDEEKCKPLEINVDLGPLKYIIAAIIFLILLIIAILALMRFMRAVKLDVSKDADGGTVMVMVQNNSRMPVRGLVLEDEIPVGSEIAVSTINVRRKESRLIWK